MSIRNRNCEDCEEDVEKSMAYMEDGAVHICGKITQPLMQVVKMIVDELVTSYKEERVRKPDQKSTWDLVFFIWTYGGDLEPTLTFLQWIDVIAARYEWLTVKTVSTGVTTSSGTLLMQAARPGKRYATPKAKFMIHYGSVEINNAILQHGRLGKIAEVTDRNKEHLTNVLRKSQKSRDFDLVDLMNRELYLPMIETEGYNVTVPEIGLIDHVGHLTKGLMMPFEGMSSSVEEGLIPNVYILCNDIWISNKIDMSEIRVACRMVKTLLSHGDTKVTIWFDGCSCRDKHLITMFRDLLFGLKSSYPETKYKAFIMGEINDEILFLTSIFEEVWISEFANIAWHPFSYNMSNGYESNVEDFSLEVKCDQMHIATLVYRDDMNEVQRSCTEGFVLRARQEPFFATPEEMLEAGIVTNILYWRQEIVEDKGETQISKSFTYSSAFKASGALAALSAAVLIARTISSRR